MGVRLVATVGVAGFCMQCGGATSPGRRAIRDEMDGAVGGATASTGGIRQESNGGGLSGGSGGSIVAGSGGAAGSPFGGAPAGGSGGVPTSAPRTLEQVVVTAPWSSGQTTHGMAVDSRGRVYLGAQAVYVYDGTGTTTFLTSDEFSAGLDGGLFPTPMIEDLDVAPDDSLYVLFGEDVFRATGAHQSTFWQHVSGIRHGHIGTIANDELLLAGDEGVVHVTRGLSEVVYSPSELPGLGSGCATEDLAVGAFGVFAYEPGCNGYPMIRGNVAGFDIGNVFTTGFQHPPYASNFMCVCRDPNGGFYMLVDPSVYTGKQLYHFSDDATATTGLLAIETTPTFAEAKKIQSGAFPFEYCSIAAGKDGSIFIDTESSLWRVSP